MCWNPDSLHVEKANWQGMLKLFRHLLTDEQYNHNHMQHEVLRNAKKTYVADWDEVLDDCVNPDSCIKATRVCDPAQSDGRNWLPFR